MTVQFYETRAEERMEDTITSKSLRRDVQSIHYHCLRLSQRQATTCAAEMA